jgi:hypothetical protein
VQQMRRFAAALALVSVVGDLDSKKTFDGEVFEIITVEDPPFVSVRLDPFNQSSPVLSDPTKWSGWIIDILAAAALRGNFRYNLRLPRNCDSSNYTCAVNQVVAGEADLYFAATYITLSRLDNTIMTSPYHTSPLSLLLPVKHTCSSHSYLKIFDPFHGSLWFAIFVIMLSAGIFYATIEPMSKEFEIRGAPRSLHFCGMELWDMWQSEDGVHLLMPYHGVVDYCCTGLCFLFQCKRRGKIDKETKGQKGERERHDQQQHTFLVILTDCFDILVHSIYLAFSSLTGANFWIPNTNGGKFFSVAFTLFTVVVIASYTANLAAHITHR